MATSARSWFYSTPEPRPYYIEERVNHTLWRNRMQGISMTCTQATVPIQMHGRWRDMPVNFEWQPGAYFILRSGEEARELIGVMRQVLMTRPHFAYTDAAGQFVVEWQLQEAEARWGALRNNNALRGLQRLREAS